MTEPIPEVEEVAPPVDPLAPDDNAPYGYTVDRATGERRAKKTPGRPRGASADSEGPVPGLGSSPSPEELKAGSKVSRETDRTPSKVRAKRGGFGGHRHREERKPKEPIDVPPFRAGPIAKGMNGLYFKAGKIIRVMDPEVGTAIISCTRKESDDDVTVGEAWEELAKANPRIRAFLLKLITGGAYTQLFMAHAPIFLAFVMKPAVAKHIPFNGLIDAVLTDDDGSPSAESQMMGGLQPQDVDQMTQMAQQMAEQMGMGGLDIGAMMRGMNGTNRAPQPGGDQYGGFQPPEEGRG